MKDRRGRDGKRTLWYHDSEIESIAEVALQRAGLMPTVDRADVDLERFIEVHLGASLDQYAPLPAGVLGTTEFIPGRPPRISINRDLTDALDGDYASPGTAGRMRATLAHEAAHVLLHSVLFELVPASLELFPSEVGSGVGKGELHRCPKSAVGHGRAQADWREVQANKGMAALLMPREVFGQVARTLIAAASDTGKISAAEISLVVPSLASRFGVSKQAASIRLETLGFITVAGQTSF